MNNISTSTSSGNDSSSNITEQKLCSNRSIDIRLASEYKSLMKDMPEGIIEIDLIESNITIWRCV